MLDSLRLSLHLHFIDNFILFFNFFLFEYVGQTNIQTS
jgi:hypothetical protein